MRRRTSVREWINRDDGRLFRIGNRRVVALEVIGTLLWIGALLLWQLHSSIHSGMWAAGIGASGLILSVVRTCRATSQIESVGRTR